MNAQNTPVHIRLWHREFWQMALANLLLSMSVYILYPLLPQCLEDNGHFTAVETGGSMAVFALGLFLFGPFCSFLVQHYRRNKVCLWSIVVMAACLGVLWYLFDGGWPSATFPLVMLLRLVQGATFGLAQMILSSTLVIDTCESYLRTEANHSMSWFGRFALSLGPLAGLFATRHFHAFITLGLFLFLGQTGEFHVEGSLDYSLMKVVPYLVVLVGAIIGINVFVILITGTVLSMAVGLATGTFTASKMFAHVGAGIYSMYDITVISVIVACIITLVKEHGGIDFVLNFIKSRISDEKGGELGIAALALLVDVCTANNTVAIVMAGPIAKDISTDFGVTPRRSASLLDMFSSMGQGLIPYGAQLLAAASLTKLTPFDIIPYCFYPLLMGLSGLVFIFIKKRTV